MFAWITASASRIRSLPHTVSATCAASNPGPLGPLWGGSDCCPSISDSRAQHLGIGYTHTFSARLLNDLHGGYFRYAVNALPFNFGKDLGHTTRHPERQPAGVSRIRVGSPTLMSLALLL